MIFKIYILSVSVREVQWLMIFPILAGLSFSVYPFPGVCKVIRGSFNFTSLVSNHTICEHPICLSPIFLFSFVKCQHKTFVHFSTELPFFLFIVPAVYIFWKWVLCWIYVLPTPRRHRFQSYVKNLFINRRVQREHRWPQIKDIEERTLHWEYGPHTNARIWVTFYS